jgi:hypothetical protein
MRRSPIVGEEPEDSVDILEFILEALHLLRSAFHRAEENVELLCGSNETSTRPTMAAAFATAERGSAMLYALC